MKNIDKIRIVGVNKLVHSVYDKILYNISLDLFKHNGLLSNCQIKSTDSKTCYPTAKCESH